MDLTRDAIQCLQESGNLSGKVFKIGDYYYSDKTLHAVFPIDDVSPDEFTSNSLETIKEYIDKDVNKREGQRRYIIHVASPKNVLLKTEESKTRSTYTHVNCEYDIKGFRFDEYMDYEKFIIDLQTCFGNDTASNRNRLIALVSNISKSDESGITDNGISQTFTVKTGVALKSKDTFVNPVMLSPYRTFPEIEQPLSPFVFRVREGRNGIECALFESNSGIWQQTATERIREYFRNIYGDNENVVIL